MSEKTKIQWCDRTWNPVRGCTRVSAGCVNCYAEQVAHRFSGPGRPYEGLTRITNGRPQWTGIVREVPGKLTEPLSWRKPARVFVNSMSDLFHEGVSDEYIASVFAVMEATPWHTYQVLTKRPERMRDWFEWRRTNPPPPFLPHQYVLGGQPWPLPNVWLGTSVEDQLTADKRIPHLLETPAAVRFVSYEPALGPVDWSDGPLSGESTMGDWSMLDGLNWVIVGGESGPHARPFDVQWARDTRDACRVAGVAFFMKQLGARPWWVDPIGGGFAFTGPLCLKDPKGGDMSEWPEDLRIRMFPGEEWQS